MSKHPEHRLIGWGHQPGDYAVRCRDCTTWFEGDKLAFRCEPCAEKAYATYLTDEALRKAWAAAKGGV